MEFDPNGESALPGIRFVRKLGQGGMGIVFEGEYLDRSERVAVKTMQHFDGVALLRFKNEFRNFADVVHPNLVALHELLEASGQWFLIMELLKGVHFGNSLRDNDSTPVSTERSTTVSLKDLAARAPQPADFSVVPRSNPVADLPLARRNLST